MANQSTSKKSLRSFHVRDGLWKLFEVKSREMDCSVDYLINEAMRLYARTHNFASSVRVEGRAPTSMGATSPNANALRSDSAVPRPTGVPPVRPSMPPAVHSPVPRAGGSVRAPMPGGTGSVQAPMPTGSGSFRAPMPSGSGSFQAPMPSGSGSFQAPMATGTGPAIPRPPSQQPPQPYARPTLTLIFQRKKIPINAQQFIIGRGSKSSDLAIKDPNISRKHAAIIFHNGAYYLKDLGSTNGIEYKGKQVDSKRIDEGDVFTICGYDLHFTYSV